MQELQTRLDNLKQHLTSLERGAGPELPGEVRHRLESVCSQRDTLERVFHSVPHPAAWVGFRVGFEQALQRLENAYVDLTTTVSAEVPGARVSSTWR